jgi:hypothetical protein
MLKPFERKEHARLLIGISSSVLYPWACICGVECLDSARRGRLGVDKEIPLVDPVLEILHIRMQVGNHHSHSLGLERKIRNLHLVPAATAKGSDGNCVPEGLRREPLFDSESPYVILSGTRKSGTRRQETSDRARVGTESGCKSQKSHRSAQLIGEGECACHQKHGVCCGAAGNSKARQLSPIIPRPTCLPRNQ